MPQARGRLAWLDISLPQRGAEGLTTIIPAVFQLLTNKEVTLPAFSITSALPSLMNGGKDFSQWSPKDDLLYKTIRVPVEVILGKDGVGLADYAVAESKVEKGEDISGRMLKIISSLREIRQRGTPDMEFTVGGLLARSQIASDQSEDAYHTITTLREQFEERGLTRFLPNMDALLCRMDLLTGNWDKAEEWYRRKAPKDLMNLNVMKRYQYFTQAMAELTEGRYDAALLTLAPGEELTPTELQILHLLCADKSNAEIAQIMDVKLPTVKTHVSHILDKLDVKRRAEAKTAAKKLHLVQDDL